ncbi:MAG: hypothetical protein ACK5P3_24100, partial [Dolichospermum sp.]
RYYEVQILIIKLLWCGQDARTRCTSLKATCCMSVFSVHLLSSRKRKLLEKVLLGVRNIQ